MRRELGEKGGREKVLEGKGGGGGQRVQETTGDETLGVRLEDETLRVRLGMKPLRVIEIRR